MSQETDFQDLTQEMRQSLKQVHTKYRIFIANLLGIIPAFPAGKFDPAESDSATIRALSEYMKDFQYMLKQTLRTQVKARAILNCANLKDEYIAAPDGESLTIHPGRRYLVAFNDTLTDNNFVLEAEQGETLKDGDVVELMPLSLEKGGDGDSLTFEGTPGVFKDRKTVNIQLDDRIETRYLHPSGIGAVYYQGEWLLIGDFHDLHVRPGVVKGKSGYAFINGDSIEQWVRVSEDGVSEWPMPWPEGYEIANTMVSSVPIGSVNPDNKVIPHYRKREFGIGSSQQEAFGSDPVVRFDVANFDQHLVPEDSAIGIRTALTFVEYPFGGTPKVQVRLSDAVNRISTTEYTEVSADGFSDAIMTLKGAYYVEGVYSGTTLTNVHLGLIGISGATPPTSTPAPALPVRINGLSLSTHTAFLAGSGTYNNGDFFICPSASYYGQSVAGGDAVQLYDGTNAVIEATDSNDTDIQCVQRLDFPVSGEIVTTLFSFIDTNGHQSYGAIKLNLNTNVREYVMPDMPAVGSAAGDVDHMVHFLYDDQVVRLEFRKSSSSVFITQNEVDISGGSIAFTNVTGDEQELSFQTESADVWSPKHVKVEGIDCLVYYDLNQDRVKVFSIRANEGGFNLREEYGFDIPNVTQIEPLYANGGSYILVNNDHRNEPPNSLDPRGGQSTMYQLSLASPKYWAVATGYSTRETSSVGFQGRPNIGF